MDGLIPRAEKRLAKSHYQHRTKRAETAAVNRPKNLAERYRPPNQQLTEMHMSGLFDLNPFHGSAPEPPVARRGKKAHHDDKTPKIKIRPDTK